MNRKIAYGMSALTAIASLLTASPSHAAIKWDLKPSGTGDFDWTLSGLYTSYAQGQYAWWDFKGMLWVDSAPECLEISTGPGHLVANPDTRIWVQYTDGPLNGNWVSVNDDWGGTLQSRARLWIAPYAGNRPPKPPIGVADLQYFTNIRPYSSAGNYDDWQFSVTRRDLTEAQCAPSPATAGTIPWAKFVGSATNTYTLTLSPNAN